ncbi:MAG TPA: response regulator transcription factor [Enhygromyxa sp.]|nr:response regulator transcription factor [Enhygromyxa sp.]
MRVLLIDDDARLFELLASYLGQNGVALERAGDGTAGLRMLSETTYDAVLLDGMLPGMDGLEVLERIRKRSAIPVLMLTARGDETDRVVGLELGADDYVAKPFSSRELLARLRAVLRRMAPAVGSERLSQNGVELEIGTREVRVDGRTVELTGIEVDLLVALMRRAGRVVPRAALLREAGRDDTSVGERTVDVHMSKLRKKLGDAAKIKTVRGVGYVLGRGDT